MSRDKKIEGDESMKKLMKVLLATLGNSNARISVATPVLGATVNYVDYDKNNRNSKKDIKQEANRS